MRQAIIDKEFMVDEQLYYTQNTYGWYYYKYFTLMEDYCFIDEIDVMPYNYWNLEDMCFLDINNKKYVVFENFYTKYVLPYKFYENIINKIYCDIYAYDDILAGGNFKYTEYCESRLIFYDEYDIVGWLEPCVLTVYGINEKLDLKNMVKKIFCGKEL